MDWNADSTIVDKGGRSAFEWAQRSGRHEIAAYLAEVATSQHDAGRRTGSSGARSKQELSGGKDTDQEHKL